MVWVVDGGRQLLPPVAGATMAMDTTPNAQMETESSTIADRKPPKLRWFYPRLRWVLIALLAVEGFLVLSEQVGWFGFREDKVGPFVIALAAVIVSILLTILWIVLRMGFRRRFQFSLRSLVILTFLVASLCSWLAVTMQDQRKQKAAAVAIKKAGGTVWSERTWVGKLLRDDSLVKVTEAHFEGQPTTDAGLTPLEALSQLQTLRLCYTKITDAGLAHLQALSQLQWLGLNGTKVNDQGVKKLQQALPKCKIERWHER
jgi:hypothetical protein